MKIQEILNKFPISFEFIPAGKYIDHEIPGGTVYLDVGNRWDYGIIDHHQLNTPGKGESTAELLLMNPGYLDRVFDGGDGATTELTIHLHANPDLDSFVSTYMALKYIYDAPIENGLDKIVQYVSGVDQGYLGLDINQRFNLYSACMVLAQTQGQAKYPDKQSAWCDLVAQTLRVVEFVHLKIAETAAEVNDIDAFDTPTPGLWGQHHRRVVEEDENRYMAKLGSANGCIQIIQNLKIPHKHKGKEQVPALLARNVQDYGDPDRVLFFKDWARTDDRLSRDKRGFVALCVSGCELAKDGSLRDYTIISVKPETNTHLKGLAGLLEQAEVAERVEKHGRDDRLIDATTGQKRKCRLGYEHPDPWYDGRGHEYTIVDAPTVGTLLSPQRVEEIFLEFAESSPEEITPVTLPDLLSESFTDDELALNSQRISNAISWIQGSREARRELQRRDIFISYNRANQQWVEANIYVPLKEYFGEDRIFFDKSSLKVGIQWLEQLNYYLNAFKLFIPVLCDYYHTKDWCRFELAHAQVEHVNNGTAILPVRLMGQSATKNLPTWLQLIQSRLFDLPKNEIRNRIVDEVRSIMRE